MRTKEPRSERAYRRAMQGRQEQMNSTLESEVTHYGSMLTCPTLTCAVVTRLLEQSEALRGWFEAEWREFEALVEETETADRLHDVLCEKLADLEVAFRASFRWNVFTRSDREDLSMDCSRAMIARYYYATCMVNVGTLGCSRCEHEVTDRCAVEMDSTVGALNASLGMGPGQWPDLVMLSDRQMHGWSCVVILFTFAAIATKLACPGVMASTTLMLARWEQKIMDLLGRRECLSFDSCGVPPPYSLKREDADVHTTGNNLTLL